MDNRRVDDLTDGEWYKEPWGQLPRLHPEGKVPCRQPNLLARCVGRRCSATAVGSHKIAIPHPKQGGASQSPGASTARNKGLDRADAGFSSLVREQGALVASGTLEWSETSSGPKEVA